MLERQRVGSGSGREDDAAPAGFYAGWEFREMPREERPGVLFDLAADPIVVLTNLRCSMRPWKNIARGSPKRLTKQKTRSPNRHARYIFTKTSGRSRSSFSRTWPSSIWGSLRRAPTSLAIADAANDAVSRQCGRVHGRGAQPAIGGAST